MFEPCEECHLDFKIFDNAISQCEHCKKYICRECYKNRHLCIECVDSLVDVCIQFLKKNEVEDSSTSK